jgi:hypothetical protein
VLSPLTAKDVQVVLLASFRGKATLYASFAPVAASWNGAPVGHVENGGLRLNDMKPGPNALSLGEGGASRDLRFDLAAGPELHAWIIEDRSTGDIRISANEPDFKVYIGEIEQPAIRAGRSAVLVRNLKPGDYSVRIVKEGHRVEPPSQMGHVTRGGQVSLEFKLVTLPATLRGAGLPPDTMILFRNETITVPREGRFERGNIPVGSYDILIRRRGYLDRRFVRQFDRGKTIEIGPGDMPQPIMGRLQIPPVSPANATIKIQCQKTEVQECPPLREVAASPSRELSLLYGDYTFTYEAPGYEPEVRNASVGDALVTPGAVTLRRRR